MNGLENIGASAGAGFVTSLVTLVFTLFGFNRRLERIEQAKLDKAIHDACSGAIVNEIRQLKNDTSNEIRQLRMDTSQDLRNLANRIDRILNNHKDE
jgi:hypothetical protein